MDVQAKIENAITKDKLLHFTIGLLLALPACLCWWLIFLPVVVGLAKEMFDKYVRKTGFNFGDLLATWAGAIPVIVILVIKYSFV